MVIRLQPEKQEERSRELVLWIMNSVLYCEEARQLLDGFGETVQALVGLHEEQFQSILGGDLDSTRFDDLIHMANERKQEAKYAYLKHLEAHGCSKYDGPEQN
jgi:hypothetical protein